MALSINSIYAQYQDLDGQPLENGYIYIGEPNQNPETAPQAVYFDSALTQPAAQPLRTVNGFVIRAGTPTNVFTTGNYSVTVRNQQGELVFTAQSATAAGGSGSETVNNLTVLGDTVLGDSIEGGNTTVILGATDVFEITNVDGDTIVQVTEAGDTIIGDPVEGGSTTVNLGTGDSFTIQNVDGDTLFQINEDGTAEYPDGQILIEDLSEEVINFIITSSSGGGGGGGAGGISSGDGRLSLASGVKVMVEDYTAVSTVYYVGGLILTLNEGSGIFAPFSIGELSQTLADATYSPAATSASQVYDIFGWKRAIVVASITRTGSVATVTTTGNHGITTGAIVQIAGATQSEYNGYQTLTAGSGTTFTFTVSGTPATPATGTITCSTGQISRGPAWKNGGQIITGATNATPPVITSNGHGMSDGDTVEINNVSGNTAVNGISTITYIDANTFSLNGKAGNGVYIAGTGSFAGRGVGAGTSQIEQLSNSYVNSVAITNGPTANMGTYLGTIATNASNQLNWIQGGTAAGGTAAVLSVWNVSNQVLVRPGVFDSTSTWTYNSTTPHAMNASNNNRVTFVNGLNTATIKANLTCHVVVTAPGAGGIMIGLDSTSVQASANVVASNSAGIITGSPEIGIGCQSTWQDYGGLGSHYLQALELKLGGGNDPDFYGSSSGFTAVPAQEQGLFVEIYM